MDAVHIFITTFTTTIGALPVLLIRNLSHRWKDSLLAFTAGIMVAASTYGLIPSALKLSSMSVLAAGILLGTFTLMLLEIVVPHHDLQHSKNNRHVNIHLFLIAMALHNLPEGISVGMSYASHYSDLGPVVAFAIGLQNLPEGFLIALFLFMQSVRGVKMVILVSATAMAEFLAGMAGLYFGESFTSLVPYGLAFSAGAMLFVVYKELIPESHGDGNERTSTFSFILGFLIMTVLTVNLR
ncbi:ZIP family metal transporter [Halobacillus salinarum]|uniref:ZIP family metal transporter n=1 Tax=Halobacillus salinarum TaxID=2932257 RepID=A0ABY4EHI5_9BACI|nr:ZIP family metal transporter [Halobacillus salinarum]UOQ43926.1 ZIP family metal transporter [Halobacillus salinarum]